MKSTLFKSRFITCFACLQLPSALMPAIGQVRLADSRRSEPLPWSQIGARAGAGYQGDGLSVTPTPMGSGTATGARLHCVFQRLEGDATRQGLWLSSTVTNTVNDHFRVVATGVRRGTVERSAAVCEAPTMASSSVSARCGWVFDHSRALLSATGRMSVDGQMVRFVRPGLVEEYSVSMDGVRQDFVVLEKPASGSAGFEIGEFGTPNRNSALRVELSVSGAAAEATTHGAQLVLDKSGRKIAYSRLRVTDAYGKGLSARMEVRGAAARAAQVNASLTGQADRVSPTPTADGAAGEVFRDGAEHDTWGACAPQLAVLVNDADAVYPVRIDPTFSDANWISMGGIPGANGAVYAAVVDGSGNLYIGGEFTVVGDVIANHIAKWNGSSWSALGSGMNGGYRSVYALAVSGSDLYAGGYFTTAGGSAANNIAKWNGSSWSALGSGIGMAMLCVCAGGVGQRPVCGGQFHDGGRQRGQSHRQMEREQLVGAGFGDGRRLFRRVCAGGVGQRPVCGGRFHDGGRQRGQLHRQMEREQLVGAGFGDERRFACVCAGGVGQRPVCGGRFHDGGRQRGQ